MKLVTKKIEADVEMALKLGSFVGNNFLLPPALERKLYQRANAALEALGGKWSRKEKAHVFPADAREALRKMLFDCEYVDETKSYDLFYTPGWLADEVVQLLPFSARDRPEARFLEPSAGEGALVAAIRRSFPKAPIAAVEARDDLKILNALAKTCGPDVRLGEDFLRYDTEHNGLWGNNFDAVVMNPPFSRGQALEHVMHAWQFLKPGGALVAIMPRGVRFAGVTKKAQAFAAWAYKIGAKWDDLPDDAFKSAGTLVRTSVLTAVKS